MTHMIVRRSLVDSNLGRPYSHMAVDMTQLQFDGAKVPTKFFSSWVQPIFEFLGARTIAVMHANILYSCLPCLQIPFDWAIVQTNTCPPSSGGCYCLDTAVSQWFEPCLFGSSSRRRRLQDTSAVRDALGSAFWSAYTRHILSYGALGGP